ncbi:MAG: helix-turn-helix transcriptional regulator [Gemmatimonadota bacterium]|nr:helix-turn-helix transcriptional regulator [Gemmatimonadota bacterium]
MRITIVEAVLWGGKNTIRAVRRVRGLTQSWLAAASGTSQPTVAAYEAGRKSPTLSTLRRLAESVGLEVRIDFHPAMTREESRSLTPEGALPRATLAPGDTGTCRCGARCRYAQRMGVGA